MPMWRTLEREPQPSRLEQMPDLAWGIVENTIGGRAVMPAAAFQAAKPAGEPAAARIGRPPLIEDGPAAAKGCF
jgi:hypothetical protein